MKVEEDRVKFRQWSRYALTRNRNQWRCRCRPQSREDVRGSRVDSQSPQNQSTPANNPQPASSSPAPPPDHSPPRSSSRNEDTNSIEWSLHSRPVVSDGQALRGIHCGSCVGIVSTLKSILSAAHAPAGLPSKGHRNNTCSPRHRSTHPTQQATNNLTRRMALSSHPYANNTNIHTLCDPNSRSHPT